MSVTCPTCDEEFDPPRRELDRGSVECPACGKAFRPRRPQPAVRRERERAADRSGLILLVLLGLGGVFALAVGGGVFYLLKAVNRPDPPLAPPVVAQQQPPAPPVELPPQPRPTPDPPVVVPPQPQPQPRPGKVPAKGKWASAVGTWQPVAPRQGYPSRLLLRPDFTGELSFDRGGGNVATHRVTVTVMFEGDRSLGLQLAVDMGSYSYTIEFVNADRIRLGAGSQAPEYTRAK